MNSIVAARRALGVGSLSNAARSAKPRHRRMDWQREHCVRDWSGPGLSDKGCWRRTPGGSRRRRYGRPPIQSYRSPHDRGL